MSINSLSKKENKRVRPETMHKEKKGKSVMRKIDDLLDKISLGKLIKGLDDDELKVD